MAPVTRKYEVTPEAVFPGAAPARAPCAGGSHTWLTESAEVAPVGVAPAGTVPPVMTCLRSPGP